MSYDVHLWHQPADRAAPATFDDVGDTVMAMMQRPPPANPRFAELAQALVARNPTEEIGWIGDPVRAARRLNQALWVLALPEGNRPRLLREVVDLALPLGLSVADPQLGLAFLPDGTVLPPENAPFWHELKQELDSHSPAPTKAQMRKLVAGKVREVLEPHGFQPIRKEEADAAFIRPLSTGHQMVWLGLYGALPDLKLWVFCGHWDGEVQRIFNDVVPKRWQQATVEFALSKFVDSQVVALRIGSVEEINQMQALLANNALAVLNLLAQPGGLLRFIQEPALFPLIVKPDRPWLATTLAELAVCESGVHRLKQLIVLWLAHAPEFERVTEEVRAYLKELVDHPEPDLDRLLAHLKTVPR